MSWSETVLPEEGRSYGNVALVQRVLAVLQAANVLSVITIKGISTSCGIPACSVVRIVETLCAEGFLVRLSRSAGYALSAKVRSLSSGYHGAPEVVEMLRGRVDALTRAHLWPFSVATLDRDAMVVQYTSLPISPLAHARTTLHKRLSLLSRAHGLAYMSACSSLERHFLARLAASAAREEDEAVGNARSWRRHLGLVRQRGYAVRLSTSDPFTQTIAVPIMVGPGRVVATLGATFFRRLVSDARRDALAAALTQAAATASARLRAGQR